MMAAKSGRQLARLSDVFDLIWFSRVEQRIYFDFHCLHNTTACSVVNAFLHVQDGLINSNACISLTTACNATILAQYEAKEESSGGLAGKTRRQGRKRGIQIPHRAD